MRPLQHAVPAVVADLLKNAPTSPGKIAFAWRTVVGAAVERVTSVRLEGRTLLVDPATPHWARELTRSRDVILDRLTTLLGPNVIDELVIRKP